VFRNTDISDLKVTNVSIEYPTAIFLCQTTENKKAKLCPKQPLGTSQCVES